MVLLGRPPPEGKTQDSLSPAVINLGTPSVGPWRSWERASMASRRSWVRIPSAPPTLFGSGPETWFTQCTGDMGNTQDRTALKNQSLLRGAPPLAGVPDCP